jgi:F-type H+-transporting ATPase subunit alpha
VRPAINVGISVSRVGGNAQTKAMKKVAGRLRLDLAQFRALEAFAEFGSDLDKASQAQLDRGARVVELLKQGQFRPFPMEKQVVSIYAVTNGYLDEIPVDKAQAFEKGLLEHMESVASDVLRTIKETGKLEEDTENDLKSAIESFKESFDPDAVEAAPGAQKIEASADDSDDNDSDDSGDGPDDSSSDDPNSEDTDTGAATPADTAELAGDTPKAGE